MAAKSLGLGHGVNALFKTNHDSHRFFQCDVDSIVANKHQPRQHFADDTLSELADSIREKGVIQPLIVVRASIDSYELIAGERRLRAAKLAGLKTVPVVVQDIEGEDSLLELALIENIQRTDLNPLEEAAAYQKLIDRFGYTQEQAAEKVGKKRSTIANTLRLLLLPDFIKTDVLSGTLSEGHARTLLRVADDQALVQKARDRVVAGQLSVRQTEQLLHRLLSPEPQRRRPLVSRRKLPLAYQNSLEHKLNATLKSRVVIKQQGKRGTIEIDYLSPVDLERLVSLITGESFS